MFLLAKWLKEHCCVDKVKYFVVIRCDQCACKKRNPSNKRTPPMKKIAAPQIKEKMNISQPFFLSLRKQQNISHETHQKSPLPKLKSKFGSSFSLKPPVSFP